MNVMHSVYDRHNERFDFCDDEENEFYFEYNKQDDTLIVRHWKIKEYEQAPGNVSIGGIKWPPEVKDMAPIVQVFFSPRRYVKDWTHD